MPTLLAQAGAPQLPLPWRLSPDAAQRIARDNGISADTVQAVARALHKEHAEHSTAELRAQVQHILDTESDPELRDCAAELLDIL
jgi:hypothetical protein